MRVTVVRKAIKNLHLGVYPPDGRVTVAAPRSMSQSAVRVAVVSKLAWIKRQRARFAQQARQSPREMVSGETHYFLGRPYRLDVVKVAGRSSVRVRPGRVIELRVRSAADAEARQEVLRQRYREYLRGAVPPLLARWQEALGVRVSYCGIKRMKTKWGSANTKARRIWVNLDLAKKAPGCLNYIVLHELVHLLERHHDDRFVALMDRHMPDWRHRRQVLNEAPLAHENWAHC